MGFWGCISSILSCICQPVADEMRNSIQTVARRFFPWITDEFISFILLRRHAVVEIPVSSTTIVGGEKTLSEIRKHLRDNSVGMIGIYGMGGIGKTTLLQQIYHEFLDSGRRGKFDLVIYATVSKEVDIPKIQKLIRDRLDLFLSESGPDASSTSVEEHAKFLFKALSKLRFLLLLDDVWAKLDLVQIGIPVPDSRRNHKIAFTTRSLQVCSDMDAYKTVPVKVLDDIHSWELFRGKIDTQVDLNNPFILHLAKQVVDRCGGLPFALITVGRAMSSSSHSSEWEHAVTALDHYAEQLRDMDQVLSALKFSYDYLKDDNMRSALLYCAMYPEDKDISREELIEYWVGEGLLEGGGDVDDRVDAARNRGHVLIRSLQDACLLEAGMEDAEVTVRLHDAVRDMALWLNRTEYDKVDGFLVVDTEDLTTQFVVTPSQRGEHVRRVWMRPLPSCVPPCPNTWTLLLKESIIEPSLVQSFFTVMTALRVLDLSHNEGLTELPVGIGLLQGLRYLNLSHTSVMSLPQELGNLVELRYLLLESCRAQIPQEAIAGLSSLQVLNMQYGYRWNTHGTSSSMEVTRGEDENQLQSMISLDDGTTLGGGRQLELSDVEGLRRLQELRIDVTTSQLLERISGSNVLRRCTRSLCLYPEWNAAVGDPPLYGEGGARLREAFNRMGGHLRELDLSDDGRHPWMGELRISLDQLHCLQRLTLSAFRQATTIVLVGSPTLQSPASPLPKLRWLCVDYSGLTELKFVGRFPCLEKIELRKCRSIQTLVLHDDQGVAGTAAAGLHDSHFPMLKTMVFSRLDSLLSVGPRPLLLPSLENIVVRGCPRLWCLPLGPGTAPELKEIFAEGSWWDSLHGANNIKSIYAPFFVPRYPT